MQFPIQLLPFSTLSPESIQRFLDDLAAISLRHGVVLDNANMMPIYPQVGGYYVGTGGYLTACDQDLMAQIVGAHARQSVQPSHLQGFMTSFADLSGHDRLRILRDLR